MVSHIVLFRPRAGLTDAERAALLDAYTRALRDIPGIRGSRVGTRVTHGRPYEQLMRENYQYCVVLDFDDVAALKSYLQHSAHEALGERFFTAFESALIYDYEMSEGVAALADLT